MGGGTSIGGGSGADGGSGGVGGGFGTPTGFTPSLMPVKGCGRSPFHSCGHGDETGAPTMPGICCPRKNINTGHLG
jgi:hypothetical protein